MSERGAMAAAIGVRVVVIAGVAALAASVLATTLPDDARITGIALIAVAAAVATRLGVVPLHRPAARLAGLAPPAALVLAAVWAPVALAWVSPAIVGAGPPPVERAVVVLVALVAVVLAALAAVLHDDLPHVVGYGIATDGAVAVLALAAPGVSGDALRTWLLVSAVVRSALGTWVIAIGGPAGIRRIGELRGWVRRSPLLAVALVAVAITLAGWPGSAAWEARADLLAAGVGGPLARFGGVAAGVVGLASAAAVVRLLVTGIARPEPGAPRESWDAEGWRLRLRLATASTLVLAGLAVVVAAGWVG